MTKYNGHRSWNAWNVSLWFNNDEGLYTWARACIEEMGKTRAAKYLTAALENQCTPDGARFNYTCIREALSTIEE